MSRVERLRLLIGAVLLVLALTLGGCGGSDVQQEQQDVKEERKDVEKARQEEQKDKVGPQGGDAKPGQGLEPGRDAEPGVGPEPGPGIDGEKK